jgi:hypothetical protein
MANTSRFPKDQSSIRMAMRNGNRQSPIGNRQSAIDNRQSTIANGNWQLAMTRAFDSLTLDSQKLFFVPGS